MEESGVVEQQSQPATAEAPKPVMWEDVQSHVSQEAFKSWLDGVRWSDDWRPDGINEPSPEPPGYGQPGVENVGFVDLHTLEPGTLVHFFGRHNGANYVIRILRPNLVKVWRSSTPAEVGGVIGTTDSIKVFDQGPSYDRLTGVGNAFKGILIRDKFRGIRPGIMMPYFAYDERGHIQQPQSGWADTIKAIYVKMPQK